MRLITKREQKAVAVLGEVRIGANTIEALTQNSGAMIRITNKFPTDTRDYPHDSGDSTVPERVAIDSECLKKLKIKKSKFPVLESILLSTHNGKVSLSTTDLETTTRMYPDEVGFRGTELEDTIPDTTPVVEMCVLKSTLMDVLRAFPGKEGVGNRGENCVIHVRVWGDQVIELRHEDEEYVTLAGLMPAREEGVR